MPRRPNDVTVLVHRELRATRWERTVKRVETKVGMCAAHVYIVTSALPFQIEKEREKEWKREEKEMQGEERSFSGQVDATFSRGSVVRGCCLPFLQS